MPRQSIGCSYWGPRSCSLLSRRLLPGFRLLSRHEPTLPWRCEMIREAANNAACSCGEKFLLLGFGSVTLGRSAAERVWLGRSGPFGLAICDLFEILRVGHRV